MKKRFRLLKNRDFQKVIGNKEQIVNSSLIIYYKKNKLENIRVGLSVSKKFGNAVVRNSTRRKIRAILQTMDIKKIKYDVVLIVRQNFINVNFEKQSKEIKKIFERLLNEKAK
ncbi:MAG: ribonuclease P protein component [Mycoplasma sp.]|nr:ribonuclease P protein component [Mycoplasma sp.]